MTIICAWCGKFMGHKEPLEDTSTTHGICAECAKKEEALDTQPKVGMIGLRGRVMHKMTTDNQGMKPRSAQSTSQVGLCGALGFFHPRRWTA